MTTTVTVVLHRMLRIEFVIIRRKTLVPAGYPTEYVGTPRGTIITST